MVGVRMPLKLLDAATADGPPQEQSMHQNWSPHMGTPPVMHGEACNGLLV